MSQRQDRAPGEGNQEGRDLLGTVVVPLDGSEFGEQVVPLVEELARRADRNTELHLVHVHVSVPVFLEGIATVNPELERDREELEEQYLSAVRDNLSSRWPGTVRTALLHGPIDETVERYAKEEGAGLVAMTTHGRGGLSRMWLGGVAHRLIRRLGSPLLLHRPEDGVPAPPDLNGPILVALDGSKTAEAALGPAASLARALKSPLHLIRVLPPFFFVGNPTLASGRTGSQEARAQLTDAAQEYLDRVVAALIEGGVEARGGILYDVPAAQGILDTANEVGAGLVAMATHGRGGLSLALMGSVADKVVRSAERPVLLLRPESGKG